MALCWQTRADNRRAQQDGFYKEMEHIAKNSAGRPWHPSRLAIFQMV